jgi:hypothetical protein
MKAVKNNNPLNKIRTQEAVLTREMKREIFLVVEW